MSEILELVLVEMGAIAVIVGILLETLKRMDLFDTKRWLPPIALVLGIAISVVYALVYKEAIFVYAIVGLFGGAVASGVYDNIMSLKG